MATRSTSLSYRSTVTSARWPSISSRRKESRCSSSWSRLPTSSCRTTGRASPCGWASTMKRCRRSTKSSSIHRYRATAKVAPMSIIRVRIWCFRGCPVRCCRPDAPTNRPLRPASIWSMPSPPTPRSRESLPPSSIGNGPARDNLCRSTCSTRSRPCRCRSCRFLPSVVSRRGARPNPTLMSIFARPTGPSAPRMVTSPSHSRH